MEGRITDIDRFSTHDGPGIRTAFFFQGCPLRCIWCHSPETQSVEAETVYRKMKCIECGSCIRVCPEHAIARQEKPDEEGHRGIRIEKELCRKCFACVKACPAKALAQSSGKVSLEEIERILVQDKPFYDNSGGGVTLSGGEILMQAEFALGILNLCKEKQIHTAIETCGYGQASQLLKIGQAADLIYYDVKVMDAGLHRRFTGRDNRRILDNLRMLSERKQETGDVVVRIPCIPGINDSPEQIGETARFVKGLGLGWLELLPYNEAAMAKYQWLFQEYQLADLHTRNKAYYTELEEVVKKAGLKPAYAHSYNTSRRKQE
ncbi:MAG: glycyl-radical enzyme activating protein [Hungatella sp.]|nr:glycyl-radical enzyme activating protein [Hungatella sp.]